MNSFFSSAVQEETACKGFDDSVFCINSLLLDGDALETRHILARSTSERGGI